MILMTYTVGQTFPDRTPERSLPSAHPRLSHTLISAGGIRIILAAIHTALVRSPISSAETYDCDLTGKLPIRARQAQNKSHHVSPKPCWPAHPATHIYPHSHHATPRTRAVLGQSSGSYQPAIIKDWI